MQIGDPTATFYKRQGKRGVRWTARVRVNGREVTKTWATLGAAQSWAEAQEIAIETGTYVETGRGVIFADLVDAFIQHRQATRSRSEKPPATCSTA